MSYSDRQVQAALAGIPLVVTGTSVQVGRRVEAIAFPGRDDHGWEDQGRKPRRYRVDALTVGPDYDLALLDLVTLLESPGPHTFVHPTLGDGRDGRTLRWVLDGDPSIDEDWTDLGAAKVSFAIVEVVDELALQVAASPAGSLSSAATYAAASGARFFADRWAIGEGGSDWTRALAAIGSAMTAAKVAAGKITSALGAANTVARTIAEVEGAVDALAGAPANFAATVGQIFASLADLVRVRDQEAAEDQDETSLAAGARVSALVRSTVEVSAWDPGEELGGTASEEAGANDLSLQVLVATAALSAASSALSALTIDTSDTALAALEDLADAIASIAETPGVGDEVYGALVDLRAALDAHLRGVALLLPSVTRYTPPESTPAILLAWRLTGDARRADEIVARNPAVPDPGALPGGEELAILA